MIWDCIVVGCGPAGGSAAYHLANRGYSVLLIDKYKLPRYKPCGGLVIDRVADWFDFDFAPAISIKVSKVRIVNERRDGFTGEVELPRPVWMVHRQAFDLFLVQQAQKRGAVLRDEFPVNDVKFHGDHWEVMSGDLSEKGRYLIAADGAKGTLASQLGFGERLRLLAGALEAEIPASAAPDAMIEMKFPPYLSGYAWNFAKARSHSIGVGMWKKERISLRTELDRYCESFGLRVSTGSVIGHPLLLWNGTQRLHTERAVLAGEAACMVDPWSAEGIRPAMMSGVKAAEAVAGSLNGSAGALANYSEVLQKELGGEMNMARIIAAGFYSDVNSDGAATRTRAVNPEAIRLWSKLLCGDLKYAQFVMGNAILQMLQPNI
jgi:geranylgeranyl reductase family protein